VENVERRTGTKDDTMHVLTERVGLHGAYGVLPDADSSVVPVFEVTKPKCHVAYVSIRGNLVFMCSDNGFHRQVVFLQLTPLLGRAILLDARMDVGNQCFMAIHRTGLLLFIVPFLFLLLDKARATNFTRLGLQ